MNLDLECAKAGYDMKGAAEDVITKSLGVLQEDGVYAFFLYLKAKDNDNKITKVCLSLLKNDRIPALKALMDGESDPCKALREKFADKLDDLLLAKDLLERALIYARYHAKAKDVVTTDSVADAASPAPSTNEKPKES